MIRSLHHIAIITNHLSKSLEFYCTALGFEIIRETFRAELNSYKIDLQGPGVQIELFTFPDAPERPSYPEAAGLRHLAFEVTDVDWWHGHCTKNHLSPEAIRRDEHTSKLFFFVADPDGVPVELYEA